MKTKTILFALFIALCALISCDRSDEPVPTQPTPKIRQITSYNHDTIRAVLTFEYDQQGRITSLTSTDGYYERYSYEPGKVLQETYSPYYNFTQLKTHYLNNKGLATTIIFKEAGHDYPEGQQDAKYEYEYDAGGYLTKASETNTFQYSITNGNTTKIEVWSMLNNAPHLERSLTRTFLNKPNTIGHENRGITFLGKQDRNPVDKDVLTETGNDHVANASYYYEYDTKNRIIKQSYSVDPGYYSTYSYYE